PATGEDEGGPLRGRPCRATTVAGEMTALRPSGAHTVGQRGRRRAFEAIGVAHEAVPFVSGGSDGCDGCRPLALASWRARQACRPARSWRTAHMMTMTASVIIATTKMPKITKKAVLPADASRRAGAMSFSGYRSAGNVTPRGHTAPMVLVAP